MTTPLTRDAARALWTETGLTSVDLTPADLRSLRAAINAEMISSGAIRDSLRCHQRFVRDLDPEGRPCFDLSCRAAYFERRQAITIEPCGFVGFAGWADDTNIQPILAGFTSWLRKRQADKTAAPSQTDGSANITSPTTAAPEPA